MEYEINKEEIRAAYDNNGSSEIIDKAFDTAYGKIREMKTESKKHKSFIFKIISGTGIGIAATFMLMMGIGFALPALAEDLPVVGGIFRYINKQEEDMYPRMGDPERLDSALVPVEENTARADVDNFTLSIKDAYTDGHFLYSSAELYCDIDPNDENLQWDYDIYIDGVLIDMHEPEYRNWVEIGVNTYVNTDMSIAIPESYRVEGAFEVRYEVHLQDKSEMMREIEENNDKDFMVLTPPKTIKTFNLSFSVEPDFTEAVKIEGPLENGEVIFRYLYQSPGGTEVSMDWLTDETNEKNMYYGTRFFTMDGEEFGYRSGFGKDSDDSTENVRYHNEKTIFDLPEGVTEFIICVSNSQRGVWGDTIAEYVVNLNDKTVMVKEG